VRVSVTPVASLSTQPIAIHVTGLKGPATLTLRSRDATGTTWSSVTHIRGDSTLGAFAVYRMTTAAENASYIWSPQHPLTFRAIVMQAGRPRASATFTRSIGGAALQKETLAQHAFFGEYAAPRGSGRRAAVLVLGGSEGALSTSFLAGTLAGHGYPALALAYFKEPGLPQTLTKIPLEYFARALRWLAAQPQVDPDRIVVLGVSRGSEVAQLLGVDYPSLVHGVVAVVPSDVANCSYPSCDASAWTFRGHPLAVGARIEDERIRGPIMFICAGKDNIWPSCDYAHDAMRHLRHDRYAHTLVTAEDSDHYVGLLIPYEPSIVSRTLRTLPDERGRELVWPKLMAFLSAQ